MTFDPPDDIELELIEGTDDVAGPTARPAALDLSFSGELWYWRGPAPYHFITVPPDPARAIRAISSAVTYGWGMIPARVRIGNRSWATALWPKDGGYVIPIKDAYRKSEELALGDVVGVQLTIGS